MRFVIKDGQEFAVRVSLLRDAAPTIESNRNRSKRDLTRDPMNLPTDPQGPESMEIDRVYFFVRQVGAARLRVNFIRYDDGSASLTGTVESSYEKGADAWRDALAFLQRESFRLHSAGPLLRMSDFQRKFAHPSLGATQWARAISEARPKGW